MRSVLLSWKMRTVDFNNREQRREANRSIDLRTAPLASMAPYKAYPVYISFHTDLPHGSRPTFHAGKAMRDLSQYLTYNSRMCAFTSLSLYSLVHCSSRLQFSTCIVNPLSVEKFLSANFLIQSKATQSGSERSLAHRLGP